VLLLLDRLFNFSAVMALLTPVLLIGGSVEDNIKRWSGQFPDGKPQVEKKTIRGLQVTVCTTAKTDEEGKRLLELLGMPFAKRG